MPDAKSNPLSSDATMQPSAPENPWVKFAGVFKDDPYFAEIAAELRQERRLETTLKR